MIHHNRSKKAALELIGNFKGRFVTDRYNAYDFYEFVRQGVIWRKISFGTQSDRGARYVERILTVCATCRLQNRSIIEYLRQACHNHLNGMLAPDLVLNV